MAVQILRFAEDGLWGKLSALGIVMILISTALTALASAAGARWTKVQKTQAG
jgi:iron(III) transport system permease protein